MLYSYLTTVLYHIAIFYTKLSQISFAIDSSLKGLIFSNQNAYIPRRLMNENSLFAYETIQIGNAQKNCA